MKRLLVILNIGTLIVLSSLFFSINSFEISASDPTIQVSGISDLEDIIANSGLTHELMGRSGLIALADFVNRGSGIATTNVAFILNGDDETSIVDGSGLKPIGFSDGENSQQFRGSFDGSGVTVMNLSLTPYEDGQFKDGVGLFGFTFEAMIENVTISGVNIDTTKNEVGSLVGFAEDTIISGITITGNVNITGFSMLGGLVGRNDAGGTITNSHLTVNYLRISGLSNVEGNTSYLGGFVGWNNDSASISNSYLSANDLTISSLSNDVGGFVGSNGSDFDSASISNSYMSVKNDLTVIGYRRLGGFVGQNITSSSITNSYILVKNDLSIIGDSRLGGFSGYNLSASISNSYISVKNNLSIIGNSRLGGFLGFNDDASISNSYIAANDLTISGTEVVGGFVGRHDDGSINSSFSAIINKIISDVSNSGPFIGELRDGSLVNTYYNSGISDGLWIEIDLNEQEAITGISENRLLDLINAGLDPASFELSGNNNFPVLIGLENQTSTPIYWLISTEEPEQQPAPTPQSNPTPSVGVPSIGQTYTYDPLFLTIEVETPTIEVGEAFELTYKAFSTFGPIIRDYTDDVVVTGTVNPNEVGSYIVVLTLTTQGLSVTEEVIIEVVDTQPPVISGPSEIQLFTNQTYESQLSVSDNSDSSVELVRLTEVDTSLRGVQEVVWQATDVYGNTSTFTQMLTIVSPEVRVEEVEVNNQQFVFVIEEDEFDFEQVIVEYVVSSNELDESSNWQPFTGSVDVQASERVFVRLSDGTNTTEIRQTVVIPEVTETRLPVLYPELTDETNHNGVLIITLMSILGVGVASGVWFIIAKRRRKKEA